MARIPGVPFCPDKFHFKVRFSELPFALCQHLEKPSIFYPRSPLPTPRSRRKWEEGPHHCTRKFLPSTGCGKLAWFILHCRIAGTSPPASGPQHLEQETDTCLDVILGHWDKVFSQTTLRLEQRANIWRADENSNFSVKAMKGL